MAETLVVLPHTIPSRDNRTSSAVAGSAQRARSTASERAAQRLQRPVTGGRGRTAPPLRLPSGARPTERATGSATDTTGTDRQSSIVDAVAISMVCLLALYVTTMAGWSIDDDGAAVVPMVALVGIAIAAIRRRPDRNTDPIRVVSFRLGLFVAASATVLTAATIADPELSRWSIGPTVTLAVIGTYLALWGFRSLALLRTISLLSLLTWAPIAEAVHDIVRSSLDQPSELVYQRLATLPVFGVADEPWTLFTASLHRGSLVVITTVLLGIAASRWRVTPLVLLDLTATAAVAVVAHHVIVLSSSIDQYDPTDTTEVATNPVLELAIALLAVLVVTAIRHRRHRHGEPAAVATTDHLDEIAARDPVIFAAGRRAPHPAVAALMVLGLAPLIVIAVIG